MTDHNTNGTDQPSPPLEPGELINVAIKDGQVHAELAGDDGIRVLSIIHGPHKNLVHLTLDGTVEVERAAPHDIQPGNLYTDRAGDLWFARRHVADFDDPTDFAGCNEEGWRLVLSPVNGGPYGGSDREPAWVARELGPLTRVYQAEATV